MRGSTVFNGQGSDRHDRPASLASPMLTRIPVLTRILPHTLLDLSLLSTTSTLILTMPSLSTRGVPAPYSPPALRSFTQSQDPQPTLRAIEQHRFNERLHVRKDGDEQLSSNIKLHPHFCLSNEDRKLAYHEGLNDIEDAVCTQAS